MSAESFIARCLQGELLTEEEYNAWLLDDTILPYIIQVSKDGLPLETVVEQGIKRICRRIASSLKKTKM